jgi:hypothetical protein
VGPGEAASKPRASDAPWHHAKPAFDEDPKPDTASEPGAGDNRDGDDHDGDKTDGGTQ